VPQPRALVTTPFHLKTLLLAGVELPPVDLLLSATAPALAAAGSARRSGDRWPARRDLRLHEAGQVATRRTTEGDTWTALADLQHRASGEQFVVSGGPCRRADDLADVLELHDSQRFMLLGRANDLITSRASAARWPT
jgi:hypothetical protein